MDMHLNVPGSETNPSRKGGARDATRRVEAMVASAFAIRLEAMRDPRRGPAHTAFARQVAMYLSHTRLGLNYTDAGSCFGRDRTTAAHACHTVEDKRANPRIDAIVDFLERAMEVWPEGLHQGQGTP